MALKLMRDHGSLKAVVKHLRDRQAEKAGEEAVKAEESSEIEEVVPESEGEDPDEVGGSSPPVKTAPKGKSRRTIHSDEDSDGSDREFTAPADESDAGEDEKPAASSSKAKAKKTAASKKAAAPKKRSNILVVPDDWPWEEARQLFLKPDVTPASEVEVSALCSIHTLNQGLIVCRPSCRSSGRCRTSTVLSSSLSARKASSASICLARPASTAPLIASIFLLSSEERVRSGAARLQKMFNAKQQGRLDGFFKVLPKKEGAKPDAASASKKAAPKRKVGCV